MRKTITIKHGSCSYFVAEGTKFMLLPDGNCLYVYDNVCGGCMGVHEGVEDWHEGSGHSHGLKRSPAARAALLDPGSLNERGFTFIFREQTYYCQSDCGREGTVVRLPDGMLLGVSGVYGDVLTVEPVVRLGKSGKRKVVAGRQLAPESFEDDCFELPTFERFSTGRSASRRREYAIDLRVRRVLSESVGLCWSEIKVALANLRRSAPNSRTLERTLRRYNKLRSNPTRRFWIQNGRLQSRAS